MIRFNWGSYTVSLPHRCLFDSRLETIRLWEFYWILDWNTFFFVLFRISIQKYCVWQVVLWNPNWINVPCFVTMFLCDISFGRRKNRTYIHPHMSKYWSAGYILDVIQWQYDVHCSACGEKYFCITFFFLLILYVECGSTHICRSLLYATSKNKCAVNKSDSMRIFIAGIQSHFACMNIFYAI